MILDSENQNDMHYAMPMQVMLYKEMEEIKESMKP